MGLRRVQKAAPPIRNASPTSPSGDNTGMAWVLLPAGMEEANTTFTAEAVYCTDALSPG